MPEGDLPILIGQYDSPFVRRVAIAMTLYAMPFERRNWSVFRDAERIAEHNPLRRVPTLLMPDGQVLVESAAILDSLDDLVADDNLLLPRRGPWRRAGLRVAALACGAADKGVALVYENVARESGSQSARWMERCRKQVGDTLLMLEQERAAVKSAWWLGDALSHADIAVAVVIHFLRQGAPQVLEELELPSLSAHADTAHELPPFQAIDEPLNFPA